MVKWVSFVLIYVKTVSIIGEGRILTDYILYCIIYLKREQ